MNHAALDKIAKAVLYEGYILYPYCRSALKNRQRWNFGVLYPELWAAAQTGTDRSFFQMQVPVIGDENARLELLVRFLHLRSGGEEEWQEGVERTINYADLNLSEIAIAPYRAKFSFEPDLVANTRMERLEGEVELSATAAADRVFVLTLRTRNETALGRLDRAGALLRSLASAHAVLGVESGEFVSLTDPPESVRAIAARCKNVGVWPVLLGEKGESDTVLGAPIILGDYPSVASESPGDLFDATEIDEILTLRVLTLTDAEKKEIRRSGDLGRRILERAESLTPDDLLRLHGTIRDLRLTRAADAWSAWDTSDQPPQIEAVQVSGVEIRRGGRLRLRPSNRADAFDLILDGKIGVVEAIERDFEEKIHLGIVLEDDPGRDLGEMRQPGHRFFFSLEEVEPVSDSCEQERDR